MKKLLALILSLLMCLSFVVSCDREEEISSSSSEESTSEQSSSGEPTSEASSSIESSSSSFEESSAIESSSSQTSEVVPNEDNLPVAELVPYMEGAYLVPELPIEARPDKFYEMVLHDTGRIEDQIITNYDDFIEIIGKEKEFEISIEESFFEENFIYATTRGWFSSYGFYDFRYIDGCGYIKMFLIPDGLDTTDQYIENRYFIALPRILFPKNIKGGLNDLEILILDDGKGYDLDRVFEGVYYIIRS